MNSLQSELYPTIEPVNNIDRSGTAKAMNVGGYRADFLFVDKEYSRKSQHYSSLEAPATKVYLIPG
ncbi:hypothetical protein, partial [Staphylococcus aureus]